MHTIVAQNDYFPFGLKHENPNLAQHTSNRYLYNGKEEQTTGGVDLLDYGARMYDPVTARFGKPDRFAEKYYNLSSYGYVAGNPIRNIDINGDSINVSKILEYDSSNDTNYLQETINDLGSQTGLTYSVNGTNMLTYAKNADGSPIIATDADGNAIGSAYARNLMMFMMNQTGIVDITMETNMGSGVRRSSPNTINLNPNQINSFINGSVGVDSRTLGWGMTLMHETFHTTLGGGLRDTPNLIHPYGTVVANMNHIRSDLNAQGGNYGQRLSYIAWATSPQHNAYVPFSLTAKMTMELKLELSLPLKYIWFKP